MRTVFKAPPKSHIEELLDTLKWMSVRQRIFYNQIVLMWRIVNDMAPDYLKENLVFAADTHNYNTTSVSDNNLFLGRGHRSSLFQNCAANWNKLPPKLRRIDKLNSFKKLLTTHVLKECPKF